MLTLVIYAHPYSKSFNHAIVESVTDSLKKSDSEYRLIDLYSDGFNPAYSTNELALFSKGQTTDELVDRYQQLLTQSERVIFVFPVWWNDVPAIIKGFIDKVMKKKFAYNVGKTGVVGNLTHIKKVTVITTSTSPTWYLKVFSGNAVSKIFMNRTLKQLGMQNRRWINFGGIDNSSVKDRRDFLQKIQSII